MMKQFIENGNLLRTIYTLLLILVTVTTIAGWKMSADANEKFATKEEVNCIKVEINDQLKEIRYDIKLLLRNIK